MEKAGSSLKGGFTSLLEGSGYSGPPCAQRLSVAGFFTTLSLFPGRRRVYSERKEASFCTGKGGNCWWAEQRCHCRVEHDDDDREQADQEAHVRDWETYLAW